MVPLELFVYSPSCQGEKFMKETYFQKGPQDSQSDYINKKKCRDHDFCPNGSSENEKYVLFITNLAFCISQKLTKKELATLVNLAFIFYETLTSVLVQRRLDCPDDKKNSLETRPNQPNEFNQQRPIGQPINPGRRLRRSDS